MYLASEKGECSISDEELYDDSYWFDDNDRDHDNYGDSDNGGRCYNDHQQESLDSKKYGNNYCNSQTSEYEYDEKGGIYSV